MDLLAFLLYASSLFASALPAELFAGSGGGAQSSSAAPIPRVVYTSNQDDQAVVELYSAVVEALPQPIKLSGPMARGGNVRQFRVTPNQEHVIYLADQEIDGHAMLYRVRADGSEPPTRISPLEHHLHFTEDLHTDNFFFDTTRTRVLYVADGKGYVLPVSGAGDPLRITDPLHTVSEEAFAEPGITVIDRLSE